ncbi:hypothetical protein L6164_016856 [Bauhinia variegata]|uniref:Uncharacterized protein n=1 Tax=Bauhinia variegata TaxID=167791 RepID=A0ACB9N776_BAUVA|nr:hypothetical protein L6164_016856 [Bauhinia variegata]
MIVSQRTPTSSVVTLPDVVGRDDDREKLINFLLSDDPNGSNIGVITIVGMGGVGKTTLAQLLYNDTRVENHFDKKACHIDLLDLHDISSLTSFPTEGLPTLQTLTINKCRNLEFQTEETWYNYKSLQELRIWVSCHSLTSFSLGCFPALKVLDICGCPNLKSISILDDVSAQSLSCLEVLYLSHSHNLESFPPGGLHTPNLSGLSIVSCEKLASLPEQIGTLATLQTLYLRNHRCLMSCPQGGLPPNLQSLVFETKISPLSIDEWGFQQLTCLSRCENSGDELVNALLKFLDGKGIEHLSSLEEIHIDECKSLKSLQEDRLSPSLKLLTTSLSSIRSKVPESQREALVQDCSHPCH